MEGVIYEVKPQDDPNEWTKLKHVPADRVWAKLSGSWRGEVHYTLTEHARSISLSSSESRLLIDLSLLPPLPKTVRPEAQQTELESRRFWSSLTALIKAKNYGEATKVKQALEQAQRDLSAKRKANNEHFEPELFEIETEDYLEHGRPVLKSSGRIVLESEFKAVGYGTC